MNLFKLAEKLNIYLLEKGVEFTEEGYPIFTEDMLLKEIPKGVCPIGYTYIAKEKSEYLLVTFSDDKNIYKKLMSLQDDIDKYLMYKGFGCIFRLNGTASPRQRKGCPLQTGSLLLANSGYACSFHSVQGGTPYE